MSKEKNKINWDKVNIGRRNRTEELKYAVFTHYSRGKVPVCAWCDCVDLDMLCLDHIEDNGKENRKEKGHSLRLYSTLLEDIALGTPSLGYQILCANHNQKKALINRK